MTPSSGRDSKHPSTPHRPGWRVVPLSPRLAHTIQQQVAYAFVPGRERPSPHPSTVGVNAVGSAALATLASHDRQGWPLVRLDPTLPPAAQSHRTPATGHVAAADQAPGTHQQHSDSDVPTTPPSPPPSPFSLRLRDTVDYWGTGSSKAGDPSPWDCQSHRRRERGENRDHPGRGMIPAQRTVSMPRTGRDCLRLQGSKKKNVGRGWGG